MPDRIMFVQQKTAFATDRGPCWICRVSFSKTWQSARFHGISLRRESGFESNFVDLESGEKWWISGPKRDRSDARCSAQQPTVDDDVRQEYEAFFTGASLLGRKNG